MPMPTAHPAFSLSTLFAARTAAALGRFAGALADAVHALRLRRDRPDRYTTEREALGGLSAHMLKDIGAASWLVADAASHSSNLRGSHFDSGVQ